MYCRHAFLIPTGSSLDKKRYDTNDLKDNNTTDIDIEKNAEGEASQKQELARLDDIDLGTSNGDKNHTADDIVQDPEVSGSPRSRGMFFGKGLRILRSLSSGLYIAEPIVSAPNCEPTGLQYSQVRAKSTLTTMPIDSSSS